jgi:phosphate transport system protein
MRTDFHADLDRLTVELADMCATAADIMSCATTALIQLDIDAEIQVTADLERLDRLAGHINERAFALLALQAPVAHDLRQVVSAIQIAADADRMGGLAANIIKVARRRHPEPAVPVQALSHFAAMGRVAVDLAENVRGALIAGDASRAERIRDEENAMDELHRALFGLVTDPRWPHGPAAAADVVLVGRFYGRFADHAIEIARRIVFRVTGASMAGR